VVVVHEGRTNFSELQAELAAGHQDRLVFCAFDLLWRDCDLRKLPQIERKQMLADLLSENDIEAPVVYSEHLTGDGHEMFEHAAKLNWEGIVFKRADAPYRSERTEAWRNSMPGFLTSCCPARSHGSCPWSSAQLIACDPSSASGRPASPVTPFVSNP
jgi:ATP-dependent DNA ligase